MTAEDAAWITASELVEVLREQRDDRGEPRSVFERGRSAGSLTALRTRHLLPAGIRRGSGRIYPARSAAQLRALLRWHRDERNLELVRVALWIEGFPIELEDVRPALTWMATHWELGFSKVLVGATTPEEQLIAITRATELIAPLRARSPIPEPLRRRRMSLAQKQAALTAMLATSLGLAMGSEMVEDGLAALDRMLGFDRRRAGLRGLLPPDDPRTLLEALSPAAIGAGIRRAHDDELEIARRIVACILEVGSGVVAVFADEFGGAHTPIVQAMREAVPARDRAGMLALGVLMLTGRLVAKRPESPPLDEFREVFDPEVVAYRAHEMLESKAEQVMFRDHLRTDVKASLEARLATEGKLSPLIPSRRGRVS